MALFFMRKASTAELDVFYPIRPECQVDVPKTRFRLRVCPFHFILFANILFSFITQFSSTSPYIRL